MRVTFLAQQLSDWMPLFGSSIVCDDIGCEILISQERESDVCVTVSTKVQLSANMDVRLVETVRYVIAKVVQPSIIEFRSGNTLEATLFLPVHGSETRLPPPLRELKAINSTDVQRLFERYLTYVHSQASGEFVHPCSAHLRNACEAGANSIEAEAIGFCVAVEGIANLIPFEATKDESFAPLRSSISEHLDRLGVESQLKTHIQNLLGQLENARVRDRLQPLIASGHLDASCFKAWKKLRDKRVPPQEVKA